MLEPQDRLLFTEALRPPQGFELSWAVGTTYTLDLVALMAAPLAFALFDWESDDAHRGPDPLALLEALRRYTGRMTVFVHAGQIAVPKPQEFLLSYLEDSVVEATAPVRGGLFHPKLWLLRFSGDDETVLYRFVCLSRNLTFDRCWDTGVVLDGSLVERQNAFSMNRPLSDFVAALARMAVRRMSTESRRRIRQMEREILKVKWELPQGFTEVRFWPKGIDGHRRLPFTGRVDRMLVVSPFLGAESLQSLAELGQNHVLISRLESLQELEAGLLALFENVYVLDDAADLDARSGEQDVEGVENVLQGLHAKLFVADSGRHGRVWTGSANATAAGLGSNVEFLVELAGSKWNCGIEALLGKGSGQARFGDLLKPYVEHEYQPPDEVEEGLRVRIERTRLALVRARLRVVVRAAEEEGRFEVMISPGRQLRLPRGVIVRCWPAMLAEGRAVRLAEGSVLARFEVAGEELGSFIAFSVEATKGTRKREERFALNLELEGAPEDRRERILRSVLKDRGRVLRFLLFLLADGDPQQASALFVSRDGASAQGDGNAAGVELPLLESMLRALEREPTKLDHVARVIEDLRKTPEGEALIPEGFTEVWEPIWAARESVR